MFSWYEFPNCDFPESVIVLIKAQWHCYVIYLSFFMKGNLFNKFICYVECLVFLYICVLFQRHKVSLRLNLVSVWCWSHFQYLYAEYLHKLNQNDKKQTFFPFVLVVRELIYKFRLCHYFLYQPSYDVFVLLRWW